MQTGRRTFISNKLLAGNNPEILRKITGHQDIKSFEKYNRIAKEQAAEIVGGF